MDSNHLRLKPTDLQSAPALQLRRTPNLWTTTKLSSAEHIINTFFSKVNIFLMYLYFSFDDLGWGDRIKVCNRMRFDSDKSLRKHIASRINQIPFSRFG